LIGFRRFTQPSIEERWKERMRRKKRQLEVRPQPESGREKKQRLRAELTARNEAEESLSAQGRRTQPRDTTGVPRWVGYAAFGLFIIGLVSFLLPWLVFSFWCYRRGRREGAALTEGVEPPVPYFPARLTGWLLASILLPIVDWFTAVHVPTICYQQGLRVGASKGTASESFTEGWELAVAAAGMTLGVWIGMAGIAFSVLVTEDNEQPASVEQPALTATTTPSPTPSWRDSFAAAFAATPQAERVSFEDMPDWEREARAKWYYEAAPPDEQEALRVEFPGLFEWLTGEPTAMPSPTALEDWVAAAEAALAEARRTATTRWQALTYDQQHTVCSEAAETLEQAANAKLNKLKPGYTWMTAKSRFYTSCMDCGGPMAVQAYITAEPLIYIGCIRFPTLGPYIPEGAEQVWP